MNITAKELSGLHIGKTVTLKVERFPNANYSPLRELTGMITAIRYTSRIIEDTALCSSVSEMRAYPDVIKIELDDREWVELPLDYTHEITIQNIRAIDLTPSHIGRVIRFTGSNGLTYKTRMRLDHFTTYSDHMKLSDSYSEYYYVDHESDIEVEETK